METFSVRLVLAGPIAENSPVIGKIFDSLDASVFVQCGVQYVAVFEDGDSAVSTAIAVITKLEAIDSSLSVVDVDDDYVNISDMAVRVDRSRQGIRLLVEGLRGPGGFPRHRGVVGDGQKIWDWASVNEWFRKCMPELADDEMCLLPEHMTEVRSWLRDSESQRSMRATLAYLLSLHRTEKDFSKMNVNSVSLAHWELGAGQGDPEMDRQFRAIVASQTR
jgi:hypothetical protein